jgi:sucrose-6-phosphate hydrolase SacC (GH32 family)
MPVFGETQASYSVNSYSAVLLPDGDTFDANQLRNPTVVHSNGQTFLYYAGLPYSNELNLCLATSNNGVDFVRYSETPIVSSAEEPWYASFRLVPVTVLVEAGVYKMWFFGNNRNSGGDPDQTTGWGYAESTDGINWQFAADPIRYETGPFSGSILLDVAKLGDQYVAFYRDRNDQSDDAAKFCSIL